jgi:hypothetical protein
MNPHIPAFLLLFLFSQVSLALPTAKITVKVVDEQGVPVEGAKVNLGFESPKGLTEGWGININLVSGVSDENGIFTGEGATTPYVNCSAVKDGHYHASRPFRDFTDITGVIGFRKYEPWNPTVELVLKKIINPIPMYAVRTAGGRPGEYPEVPVVGEFVGYDLMANDWVAPYGRGEHGDFLFKVDIARANANRDYDVTLTLKFSSPGDGVIKHMTDDGHGKSLLRMPHHAPVSGYTNQLSQRHRRTPGVRNASESIKFDPDTNYFFRVRTKHDKGGKVIGGLYGKIHGPIELGNYAWLHSEKPYLSFNYYLNPNDNDTNIEFDLERNLFTDIPYRLKVTNP